MSRARPSVLDPDDRGPWGFVPLRGLGYFDRYVCLADESESPAGQCWNGRKGACAVWCACFGCRNCRAADVSACRCQRIKSHHWAADMRSLEKGWRLYYSWRLPRADRAWPYERLQEVFWDQCGAVDAPADVCDVERMEECYAARMAALQARWVEPVLGDHLPTPLVSTVSSYLVPVLQSEAGPGETYFSVQYDVGSSEWVVRHQYDGAEPRPRTDVGRRRYACAARLDCLDDLTRVADDAGLAELRAWAAEHAETAHVEAEETSDALRIVRVRGPYEPDGECARCGHPHRPTIADPGPVEENGANLCRHCWDEHTCHRCGDYVTRVQAQECGPCRTARPGVARKTLEHVVATGHAPYRAETQRLLAEVGICLARVIDGLDSLERKLSSAAWRYAGARAWRHSAATA